MNSMTRTLFLAMMGCGTGIPLALELLKRDIENLIRDFKKLGINISIDEIKSKIMDVKG